MREIKASWLAPGVLTGGLLLFAGCAQPVTPPLKSSASPRPYCFMCGDGPRQYLIFFDWNSYSLSPRAQQIISRFVDDNKTDGYSEIYVSGFTDTSGRTDRNIDLSSKRAHAVADQLLADGIPKDKMKIFAFGDKVLLKPTPPNMREEANRRVEIMAFFSGDRIPPYPYQTRPLKVIELKHGILIE